MPTPATKAAEVAAQYHSPFGVQAGITGSYSSAISGDMDSTCSILKRGHNQILFQCVEK